MALTFMFSSVWAAELVEVQNGQRIGSIVESSHNGIEEGLARIAIQADEMGGKSYRITGINDNENGSFNIFAEVYR
ncbi:DUF1471 domain-containing protein [Thorsellia anophelis]|nr:DUF1471 domain-containing protein [Thorsellia anophelis]